MRWSKFCCFNLSSKLKNTYLNVTELEIKIDLIDMLKTLSVENFIEIT